MSAGAFTRMVPPVSGMICTGMPGISGGCVSGVGDSTGVGDGGRGDGGCDCVGADDCAGVDCVASGEGDDGRGGVSSSSAREELRVGGDSSELFFPP